MPLTYGDLYTAAARWAGDTSTTGTARARDAVVLAIRELTYGAQLPLLRPWWRKREDTITPVAGTQSYAFPTAQGTMESLHQVWYRTNGRRHLIEIADDVRWSHEANEDTGETGTPTICNLHASSGSTRLRFSITPGSGWISSLTGGVIRLDFFILDTLADSLISGTGSDSTEPLMPDSRREGILWKAVEKLAALQGDNDLLLYAASQGKRFYELLLADDITRTGNQTQLIEPMERPGDVGSRARETDYGRVLG